MTFIERQDALLAAVMADPSERFTQAERKLLFWQRNRETSHFRLAFWQALFRADSENLARFEKGFPDEVAALRAWRHGDLAERARAFGLEV